MTPAGHEAAPWPAGVTEAMAPGGFLAAYVAAARQVELEPYRHLRQAGLPTRDFDQVAVSHAKFMELVQGAARISRRPDFALLLVRQFSLATLGPVGLLAGAQPTVGEALTVLCRFSSDRGRRMRAVLERRGEMATIRFYLRGDAARGGSTASVVTAGLGVRVLQSLLGETWRQRQVLLSCPPPAAVEPYRDLFGEVVFDQSCEAIAFEARDLDRPLATANPELARAAADYLARIAPVPRVSFQQEVRDVIAERLAHGGCTIAAAAERLGVDRRTVHRRLAETGATFTDLVQAARREAAEAGLARGEPAAGLARRLGLSGASAFSRWFRQTYGAPPSRYGRGD